MNNYRKLTDSIPLPAGLNDRVVMAARQSSRPSPPFLRAAVCAALVIALLAGTFTRDREEPASLPLTYECSITALAVSQTANDTLALPIENGSVRFLAGESLTADRGKLTREDEVYTLTGVEGGSVTLTLEAEKYRFRTEDLGTFLNEDGTPILSPVLSGDDRETIPVLYSATEESRFLSWPVEGCSTVSLSNSYGSRETPGGTIFHAGIDIPGARGLSISAAANGTVLEAGFDPERGNYLLLDHGEGLTTLYAHCQEILVQTGTRVKEGDTIALLGSTGLSTGPHLHFEVRRDGTAQNPVAYFTPELRDTLSMG